MLDGYVQLFQYKKKWLLKNSSSDKVYYDIGDTVPGNNYSDDWRSLEDVGINKGDHLLVISTRNQSDGSSGLSV